MRNIYYLFIGLLCCLGMRAQEKFQVRGVLPWHNFLSGPTAWNLEDYRNYLDECRRNGINFIGFHTYTGGGERYATYVEPMIKIQYKQILPQACFDNSLTARWGYLPMRVQDFAFGTGRAFTLPDGAEAFGNTGSVTARTTLEHYERAQQLMRDVLTLAHERGIRMAMGFEFGVLPPEYFSLNEAGDCFYWPGESNMIPNPKSRLAADIHRAALDDILRAYPDIDYIWLWLNEHSFMGADIRKAMQNEPFARAYREQEGYFEEAPDSAARFVGVWALEYMKLTAGYLKAKGSQARIILGGWGGGHQLPALLKGLDRALPRDIVFSCLNPDLGKSPQPDFLADIARNREVWAVPWLEGDHQLWHFQPRVELMREHVKLAARQGLDGVVAIHWRTEEPRFNFRAFARFASDKEAEENVEQLYGRFLEEEFGSEAARLLTPLLARMDREQIHGNVPSPEFYAYTPEWGMLDEANVRLRRELVAAGEAALERTTGEQRNNLERFVAMFRFELLLGEVGRAMQPAFALKKQEAEGGGPVRPGACEAAYRSLRSAPVQEMFEAYLQRVHSRGELGVLCSLNQRLWREYCELERYLENKRKD